MRRPRTMLAVTLSVDLLLLILTLALDWHAIVVHPWQSLIVVVGVTLAATIRVRISSAPTLSTLSLGPMALSLLLLWTNAPAAVFGLWVLGMAVGIAWMQRNLATSAWLVLSAIPSGGVILAAQMAVPLVGDASTRGPVAEALLLDGRVLKLAIGFVGYFLVCIALSLIPAAIGGKGAFRTILDGTSWLRIAVIVLAQGAASWVCLAVLQVHPEGLFRVLLNRLAGPMETLVIVIAMVGSTVSLIHAHAAGKREEGLAAAITSIPWPSGLPTDEQALSYLRDALPNRDISILRPVSGEDTADSGSRIVSSLIEGSAEPFRLVVRRRVWQQPFGPYDRHLLATYRRGLIAGTAHLRPGGRVVPGESWPAIGSSQPMVESADVAIGLGLTRPWLWDTLDEAAQDAVETWLRGAIDHEPAPNNWNLFPLMVGGFLESAGRGDAATDRAVARGLELLDAWYLGNGWYRDGDLDAFDHYIGWTMHFYPLLHAWMREDTTLLTGLAERLTPFLQTYGRTFGSDGAPLYQGRSLTYRMAALAPVAMGAVTGSLPFAPGAARALCSRTLRYFLSHGATTRGVLSLGWHGEHADTVQSYSGPGSPYWASHGFAALLLPASHPFWSAPEEEPFPGESSAVAAQPGWVIQRTADGVARVHNHGSDDVNVDQGFTTEPNVLYSRLAYSTITGPTRADQPSDNDVQIEYRGGQSTRRHFSLLTTGSGDGHVGAWAASTWRPVFPGLRGFDGMSGGGGIPIAGASIDVLTLAAGPWDVRVARLRHVPAGLPVRVSGWALTGEDPSRLRTSLSEDGYGVAIVRDDGLVSEIFTLGQNGAAEGNTGVKSTHVTGTAATDAPGEDTDMKDAAGDHVGSADTGDAGKRADAVSGGLTTALADRAPGGTAYGPWALVPSVRGVTGGGTHLLAVATRLATDGAVSCGTDSRPTADSHGSIAHIHTETGAWRIDWTDLVPRVEAV